MKKLFRLAMICFTSLLSIQTFAAESPALAKPGKPLFEDNFARAEMAPKWRVGKGFFSVKESIINVAENPADMHGAYAYVTPNFVFKDIVTEFSVKMDGARTCSLMINDNKYKESHAGHILKASLALGKLNLSDWKNGAMKNGIYEKMKDTATSNDEKKKLRDSIKSTSADFKTETDLAKWHTVRVEIVGDEMLMAIDGKPVAYLKSPGVDHATKNAIGFEVGGKSVDIKDMKVWEAVANKDWASHREAVVKSLEK